MADEERTKASEMRSSELSNYNGVWCNTCASSAENCKKCLQDDGIPTHYTIDQTKARSASRRCSWCFDSMLGDIKDAEKTAFAILYLSPDGKVGRCYSGLDLGIFEIFAEQIKTDAHGINVKSILEMKDETEI